MFTLMADCLAKEKLIKYHFMIPSLWRIPLGLPVVPEDQKITAHSSQGSLSSNSVGLLTCFSSARVAWATKLGILQSSTPSIERRQTSGRSRRAFFTFCSVSVSQTTSLALISSTCKHKFAQNYTAVRWAERSVCNSDWRNICRILRYLILYCISIEGKIPTAHNSS